LVVQRSLWHAASPFRFADGELHLLAGDGVLLLVLRVWCSSNRAGELSASRSFWLLDVAARVAEQADLACCAARRLSQASTCGDWLFSLHY
jgi:hypothetical protein